MTDDPVRPIILVSYGPSHRPALDRLLAQTRRPVIRVRTDDSPGECVADLNEAFEFSGYQEGLGRILRDLPGDGDAPLFVTFVNDTLATGHPRCVAQGLLDALACRPHHPSMAAATPAPRLLGWHMPLAAALHGVSGARGYVSTWAFTLAARREDLARVRFYGPHEVDSCFDATWAGLPAPYKDWVNRWLAPTHWLRGWYKACPGRPLDDATRRRKRLSIYLEHTLALRLAPLGFEPMDAGRCVGAGQAALLRCLRGLDRINVNRLKLAHRLPHLLPWRA